MEALPAERSSAEAGWIAVAEALARAASPGEVLEAIADAAEPIIGASLVNISLLDPGGRYLRLVTTRRTPEAVSEDFSVWATDAPLPSTDALRTGEPVVLRSLAERDRRYPLLEGVEVEQQAFVILPLVYRGRALGVLGVGWDEPQAFDAAQLESATAMAALCTAALARAQSGERERAARESAEAALGRLGVLNRLITTLAATDDAAAVAQAVLDAVAPAVGASAATVATLEGDRLSVVADAGLDEGLTVQWRTLGVEDTLLTRELFTTGKPVWVSSRADRDARFPDMVDNGVTQESWANLPLLVGDRLLGSLSFGWDEAGEFAAEDRDFFVAVAAHVALAIDRGQRLEGSRGTAETLQRALLPPRPPALRGWRLGACYVPAVEGTQVGGDWYDVFPLPDGRHGLVLGDVMGKGVRAAAVMGTVRSVVRAYATTDPDPAAVLSAVDRYLVLFGQEMTTCVYALLDPETGRLAYANAGHPPPLLLPGSTSSAGGAGSEWLAAGSGPPLGVIPDAARRTATADVEPGGSLLLYSDGLVEDRYRSISEGMEELRAEVSGLEARSDLSVAAARIVAVLTAGHRNVDDVALLAARRDG